MVSLWTESEELDSRCGQSITELIPRGREAFLEAKTLSLLNTLDSGGEKNTQNQ